jgi:hypothetical protein
VQFCALDFLEQHGSDDRLMVLGLQSEISDKVGFRGQKVNGRARPARSVGIHDVLLGARMAVRQLYEGTHCSGRLRRWFETFLS